MMMRTNALVANISPLESEGEDTVILITVTAEDGVSDATYKVTVARDALPTSTEDSLSALNLMAGGEDLQLMNADGTDDAEFAEATPPAYTARVPYSTTSVTVMATPTNRGASYAVTSDKDDSIQNGRVDLSEGDNIITVKVTAAVGPATPDTADDCAENSPDANITCYTVTVTRALRTASRDTTLTALSITEQSGDTPTVSGFMPAFVPDGAPASSGYTAYAATGVAVVTLTAQATHSSATVAVKAGEDEDAAEDAEAIDAESNGTYTYIVAAGAGFQGVGEDTVILVTVTAADGFAMSTYKLTVMRGAALSNVITLSALSLMDGSNEVGIAPTFDSDAYAYTARVPNATTMVEVMATPTDADDGATYAVASDKDSSIRNNVVDLAEGNNVITVTVTAADRVTTSTVTTSYVVTVERVASNLSADTSLSVLTVMTSVPT